MKAKAAAYIRVSTDEQARGGVSLEAQEEKLRAYCTISGLELVCLIREEGVSAAKPLASRPGGSQLLSLVAWKKIPHIVALKLDRLFRDAEDALRQTKAWDKASVALHLVDMGGQTLNTASAMGRFLLNMMAGFAELERNLIAERTAAAMIHRKAHRRIYGPTPYGFDRCGEVLRPNAYELGFVELAKVCREAGWSLHRIAKELNRLDVKTKRGARWHASTVRYLLQNDLYEKAA
jgi:DNA invertase Pin-like site-specific DNA recombinase